MKLLTFPFRWFKSRSRRGKIIILVILILIMGTGYWYWQKTRQADGYIMEYPQRGNITEIISETGNVTIAGASPVYSTANGLVDEVFVSNGEMVEEDDVLFTVKSTATDKEQADAYAAFLAAKSTRESLEAKKAQYQATMFDKWDTFMELADETEYDEYHLYNRDRPEYHIPEKEWLSAEATYKAQDQAIAHARSTQSAAWLAYQATLDSQVTAIISGQVRNLAVAKGDLVKALTAATLSTTEPALILIDNQVRTFIKVMLNETDVIKVAPGQPVTIELDAIDGQTFSGTVDRVDTVASPSADVVEFAVYVLLDDQNELIKRGMTADVDITVATKTNVLTVPSSAIKPYQGGKAVRALGDNGEVKFIPVTIGLRGNGKTEILSGIDENTQVIVALANEQIERSSGFFR